MDTAGFRHSYWLVVTLIPHTTVQPLLILSINSFLTQILNLYSLHSTAVHFHELPPLGQPPKTFGVVSSHIVPVSPAKCARGQCIDVARKRRACDRIRKTSPANDGTREQWRGFHSSLCGCPVMWPYGCKEAAQKHGHLELIKALARTTYTWQAAKTRVLVAVRAMGLGLFPM